MLALQTLSGAAPSPILVPAWAVPLIVALALLTGWMLARRSAAATGAGRFASIDGLRGLLALFVFIHHGSVWQVFLATQRWEPPASRAFSHMGETSVALFFMITAFLFTRKVLQMDERPIQWVQLYASRLGRLLPLYALAIAIMLGMAWILTGATLQEPPQQLLLNTLGWLAFSIRGAGNLNGLTDTYQLIAGVTWSLRYEWWFYLSLPLLAVLLKRRIQMPWSVLALINVALFGSAWLLRVELALPFLGGVAAAYAVQWPTVQKVAARRWSGFIVLGGLALTVLGTESAYTPEATVLLGVAFILIAAGNDLFGLLSTATLRALGELTYSLYLLHGLALTLVLRLWAGTAEAALWSPSQHWLVMAALTVPLLLACHLAYQYVEVPGQRLGTLAANLAAKRR